MRFSFVYNCVITQTTTSVFSSSSSFSLHWLYGWLHWVLHTYIETYQFSNWFSVPLTTRHLTPYLFPPPQSTVRIVILERLRKQGALPCLCTSLQRFLCWVHRAALPWRRWTWAACRAAPSTPSSAKWRKVRWERWMLQPHVQRRTEEACRRSFSLTRHPASSVETGFLDLPLTLRSVPPTSSPDDSVRVNFDACLITSLKLEDGPL